MGYYLTVLAQKTNHVPAAQLRQRLQADGMGTVKVTIEEVGEDFDEGWKQIVLQHGDGREITSIRRAPVEPGSLGQGIIKDFLLQIQERQPQSARKWLTHYLPTVKVVYSLQILSGTDVGRGWEAVWAIQDELLSTLGGISHAEAEGFSNQEGYHILWEFNDTVDGPWKMAVLNESNQWEAFEMDLGNPFHREAFKSGRVPDGVSRLHTYPATALPCMTWNTHLPFD